MSDVRLRRNDEHSRMHPGGTVTYEVWDDGRSIGSIGDGRPWRGRRFGRRGWWACWREHGDDDARWSSGLYFTTRRGAVDGLLLQSGRSTS